MAWPSPHDWKEMRAFLTEETPGAVDPTTRPTQPYLKTELREPQKPKPVAPGR